MITFLDGPAADVSLRLLRTPILLRVVLSPGGHWDALDQLDDEAKPREKIFVYQLASNVTRCHIKAQRRRESGMYYCANYKLHHTQPGDEHTRSNEDWSAWCESVRDDVMRERSA